MPKAKKKARAKAAKSKAAGSAAKALPAPVPGTPLIPEWEWDLPAGFTADGSRMASLREVVDPKLPTRNLLQLSEDHRFDLAAKRIEMGPNDFTVTIPGYDTLNKRQAVAEIRDRSRIGRHLAEVQFLGIDRGVKFGKLARAGKGDGDGGNGTGN